MKRMIVCVWIALCWLTLACAEEETGTQTVNLRERIGYAADTTYTGSSDIALTTDIVVNAAGQQIQQQSTMNAFAEFEDTVTAVDAVGFPTALDRAYGDMSVELVDTIQQTTTSITPSYANKLIHLEAVGEGAWTAECGDQTVTQAELAMLATMFGAQKGEFELLPDENMAAGQTWEPNGEAYGQSFLAGFKAGMGLGADVECTIDEIEIVGQLTTVTEALVEYEVDISCTVTAPTALWTLVVEVETAVHGKLTGNVLEIQSDSTLTYSTLVAEGETPENSMAGTGELSLTFNRTENE